MQSSTILETKATASLIGGIEAAGERNCGVKVRKWNRAEYYQMAELGFFQDKRVELIEGEIIEMAPMNQPHATAIRIILAVLRKVFNEKYIVDSQLPLSFGKTNEPEPDVAVIEGSVRDFSDSHPTDAALIVEVSDTTLRFDRTVKASLYAQNKISDYWILNLKDRCLEIYRQPKKDKKLGFVYTEIKILTEGDFAAPLAAPDANIKIDDILP